MSTELSTKPLVQIEKNAREQIWLALDRWIDPKGGSHNLCNVRIFAKDKTGMKPTHKGLGLAVKQLPELIAGLQKVEQAAIKKGWLANG